MRWIPALVCLLAVAFNSPAQDRTIGDRTTDGLRKKARILVIPTNPTMYRGDADQEFASANGTSIQQVRKYIRRELALEVAAQAAALHTTLVFDPELAEWEHDLQYTYVSTGYKAEIIDPPAGDAAADARSNGGIRNGQLAVEPQRYEKFMKTMVTNPGLLPTFNDDFGARWVIFLGEIDVVMAGGATQELIQRNTYQREIRVHYTVLNTSGEEMSSGIASCSIPSRLLSLVKIKQRCFGPLAAEIVSGIPAQKISENPEP